MPGGYREVKFRVLGHLLVDGEVDFDFDHLLVQQFQSLPQFDLLFEQLVQLSTD